MNKEKNYCVYRHLKPNGEVFYIGLGTKNRPYDKHGRSKEWKDLVDSEHFYEVQILTKGLSKEEASEIEILLISWYKRRDCCGGTLVNLTDGGATGCNWIPSKEWRDHKSKVLQGDKNPNYGNKWIDEQKEKARQRMLGKYSGDKNPMFGVTRESPFKGKTHSEETKKLLRKPKYTTRAENAHNCKIILNQETGIFYFGIADAMKTQCTYKSLSHFTSVLSGRYKNKTYFIIC